MNPVMSRFFAEPENAILFDKRAISAVCEKINEFIPLMDMRPTVSEDQFEKVREECEEIAPGAFEAISSFFGDRKFFERDSKDKSVHLNTKLDVEWAYNVFYNGYKLLGTGVFKLDDILKGGLRVPVEQVDDADLKCPRSHHILLQGRPGTGKTTTAILMICNFAAQGVDSLYLAVEQDLIGLRDIVQRYCSRFEEIETASGVFECELRHRPQNDRTTEFEIEAGKSFFVVFPNENGNVSESQTEIIRAQRTQGTSGIVFGRVAVPLNLEDVEYPPPSGFVDITPIGLVNKIETFERDIMPDMADRTSTEPRIGLSVFPWIIIDSITSCPNLSTRHASVVLKYIRPHTSLLALTERLSENNAPPTEEETCFDSLIQLGEREIQVDRRGPYNSSPYRQRFLEVRKCRIGPFHRGENPMAIKSTGVKVYRSITVLHKVTGNRRRKANLEDKVDSKNDNRVLRFGVNGLDGPDGLNGSLLTGSTTLLEGEPGSHKTNLVSYFALHELHRWSLKHKPYQESLDFDNDDLPGGRPPRTLYYGFSVDRRAIVSRLRGCLSEKGNEVFLADFLRKDAYGKNEILQIRDISAGYLFPEQFVEDLMETLFRAHDAGNPFTRVVLDSYDNVHASFPVIRNEQNFWQVVCKVCSDYQASTLIKMSRLERAMEYYHDMANLVHNEADNIISVDRDHILRIVETEKGLHASGPLRIVAHTRKTDGSDYKNGVYLQVLRG